MINNTNIRSTTIIATIHKGELAIAGDGQATMGNTVVKSNVNKLRSSGSNILAGFAGSTADALTLWDEFEKRLSSYSQDMERAAIELTKSWRTERHLRRLEAMMIIANRERIFILSGSGDVLEPDNKIAAIGSGSMYAQSSASALKQFAPQLSARQIVTESLKIAANICIYTNSNIVVNTLSEKE